MPNNYAITTGEQSPTTTGAVTGTLNTSTLVAGEGTLHIRLRGLQAGQNCRVAIEDTANGTTPFSDASTVYEFDFYGDGSVDGFTVSREMIYLQSARIGATNNQLRANVTALAAGATPQVLAWLDQ